jgi:hypothetical protein
MGHVDVETTMKYQHPELDIVRTALNETAPACDKSAGSQIQLRHTWKFQAHDNR